MWYNKHMWTVYKVIIQSKIYVGITSKGLDWRKRRHQVEARRGLTKTIFHNTLNKHMGEAQWEQLDVVSSKDEAVTLEKYYISHFNSLYPNGLNLTSGGEGVESHKHTDEAKRKISVGNKGYKASTATRKLISKATKGKSKKPWTEEQKLKKAKLSGSKPFDVFSTDGSYIGTWINKSQCARDLDICRESIIYSLKLSKKKIGHNVKYIFRYK